MLDTLHPELRDSIDAQSQLRMRLGQEVGMLARQRYPGGEIGRIPGAIEPSLKRTQELIESGVTVLYEPAFRHAGVFIQVDILAKGELGWRLIEVKSTSQVKDHHLWDVAIQLFVLRGEGVPIEDATLLHMNRDYVRQGALDLGELFTESPLLAQAQELFPEVEASVRRSIAHLESGEIPDLDIGPYCLEPENCDFIGHCWEHLPDPSVFNVYRLTSKKKFELYDSGITQIEQIPATFEMPSSSTFHAEAHKAGKVILKRDQLHIFIEDLIYPLYFLDFETFGIPIPPYDGIRPYSNVPFQYSLHVQEHPDQEPRHSGFLAKAGVDPRQEFVERMLADTEGTGNIVVYNASFERNVLRGLAEQLPEYSEAFEQRIDRMVDLMEPFRQRLYWTPEMGGSVSLKSVLPALVPELSYDVLVVQDGTQAMSVYLGLADLGDVSSAEELRQALWEYCELDTLAMVRILGALRAITTG